MSRDIGLQDLDYLFKDKTRAEVCILSGSLLGGGWPDIRLPAPACTCNNTLVQ
jgi:hypothetical protein